MQGRARRIGSISYFGLPAAEHSRQCSWGDSHTRRSGNRWAERECSAVGSGVYGLSAGMQLEKQRRAAALQIQ